MGSAAESWLILTSASIISRPWASICSRPALSIRAWERLLMSSLVQAKCTYSSTASSSGLPANCFFRKYSTALTSWRSEEHTSELQSRGHLVCRLLLEKKKQMTGERHIHGGE